MFKYALLVMLAALFGNGTAFAQENRGTSEQRAHGKAGVLRCGETARELRLCDVHGVLEGPRAWSGRQPVELYTLLVRVDDTKHVVRRQYLLGGGLRGEGVVETEPARSFGSPWHEVVDDPHRGDTSVAALGMSAVEAEEPVVTSARLARGNGDAMRSVQRRVDLVDRAERVV